uniref:Uncharacterized protein n=1 Tax=Nothoprocta perdicaria TaxID=30464 RepID=A0A8C6Z968_NOTPE
ASSRPKAGGAQRKRAQRSPSRERISPCKRSCGKDQAPTGSDSAPRPFSSGPRARHHWWRRWSLKGTTCRKSLPPFHEDIAGKRCPSLPCSSQAARVIICKRKAWHSLTHAPRSLIFCRFTTELQSWDLLLLEYQQTAENMSRRLEECKLKGGNVEPESYLGSSQAEVVLSKPDYQKILDDQRELERIFWGKKTFSTVGQLLRAIVDTGTESLQNVSGTLGKRRPGAEPPRSGAPAPPSQPLWSLAAARTFRRMERSPVRRLLAPSAVAPSVAPSAGPSVAAPSASPSAVAPSAAAPPDA